MADIEKIYRKYNHQRNLKTIEAEKLITSLVSICHKNMWARNIEIEIEYYSAYCNIINDDSPLTTVTYKSKIPIPTYEISTSGV